MGREDVWRIRDDRSLSWAAKLVWLMLESRGEDCRPSVAVIAADCGITKPTVRKARAELVAGGWLKEASAVSAAGDSDSNSYLVTTPRWGGKPPCPPPTGTPSSEAGGQAPFPPGWSTTDTRVGNDVDHGGQPPFPKEEKGSVKGKCKKTSTDAAPLREPADEIVEGVIVDDEATPQNAGTLLAEWIDHCQHAPPKSKIGQLGRRLKKLLDEDKIPYQVVRAGLADWHKTDATVGGLDHFVTQRAKGIPVRTRGGNRLQRNHDARAEYLARLQEETNETGRKAIGS